MDKALQVRVEEAKKAALDVLLHNSHGPCRGLPRAAGWGYPEPYTRDLMITALGMLTCGNKRFLQPVRRVLKALARNQSKLGSIPSLAHDPAGRGASDTTPLFLIALAAYRRATGETDFLEEAARRALTWVEYQSSEDRVIVTQQPTTDWRDEHWVLGQGLYVNALVYAQLRLFGFHRRAEYLRAHMNWPIQKPQLDSGHPHAGLAVPGKPYYALWSFKLYGSERFDLLGNSLAILTGIASPSRSAAIVSWAEKKSAALRRAGELAVDLPPCLMPYMRPGDPDWRTRYGFYNKIGAYHNGGVWPFICGFYVAALVAAGRQRLAEQRLSALTDLVRPARAANVEFGFNEWFQARTGKPEGQDWQTWSAGMYLYAAACVEQRKTPFFDEMRRYGARPLNRAAEW